MKNIFCNQVDYMFFICGICVSLREAICQVVDVFICYFLYLVPNYFVIGIGIGVHLRGESFPGGSLGFFDGMSSFGSLFLVFA